MHTDEFEISLSRELDVCRKKVKAIKNKLSAMEQKFSMTTEAFVCNNGQGKLSPEHKEFIDWMDDYHALTKWQTSLNEYEELFSRMKR